MSGLVVGPDGRPAPGAEVIAAGGDWDDEPPALLGRTTATSFTDTMVAEGATYYYVVRAIDLSFNHSADTAPVQATAETRKVSVVFTVNVPATTDATGRRVYIAGTLSRLDGGLPDWDPGGVVLTRKSATQWTITLSGLEGTQLEYKYTLGDWDHVEKGAGCAELGNRSLTLASGSQTDTVAGWRNVSPCGA